MLQGVYDLTDDRDFMNDVPNHLSMKGLDPDKLFKSKKERNRIRMEKDRRWENAISGTIWENATYNITSTTSGDINIRSSTTGINYTYTNGGTITWTGDNTWNYATTVSFNDSFNTWNDLSIGGTTDFDEIYDSIARTIEINSNKSKPKAVLPWVRERAIETETRPTFKIRKCVYHGKYFSWRRISKKRKNYKYYSECPKCMEMYQFKDDLPWLLKDKPQDMPYKSASLSYDTRYYLTRKMQILRHRGLNVDLKQHNVPWKNKYIRELMKEISDEVFYTYYDKHVPWYKNMSERGIREYIAELYEDETTQEESSRDNQDNDIIDRDTKEMERYLNMRPGTNGGMWH